LAQAFSPGAGLSTEQPGHHHDSTSPGGYYMAPMRSCEGDEPDGRSPCRHDRSSIGRPAPGEEGSDHPALRHVTHDRQDLGDDAGR
jgi:hypothetical protein